MKKPGAIITLVWIALGVFVSAYAYRLGLGALTGPGPGFMPFWLGIVITCLALYRLVTYCRVPGATAGEDGATVQKRAGGYGSIVKLAFVTIALLAYALFLEPLGYVVTTFLSMVFLLRFAGYTRWVPIIGNAVVIAGASYFLFHYLGVMLPAGLFHGLGPA